MGAVCLMITDRTQHDAVTMIRDHLNDIPRHTLSGGYSIRWYRDGDEVHWVDIQSRADRYNQIDMTLFKRSFGYPKPYLANRQCYLLDDSNETIGTATAWYNKDYHGLRYGRIHWLAIIPEMQGLGLAKSLMSVICNRLLQLGHWQTYLKTAPIRLNAIALYLKFGFKPEIQDENAEIQWRQIRRQLD